MTRAQKRRIGVHQRAPFTASQTQCARRWTGTTRAASDAMPFAAPARGPARPSTGQNQMPEPAVSMKGPSVCGVRMWVIRPCPELSFKISHSGGELRSSQATRVDEPVKQPLPANRVTGRQRASTFGAAQLLLPKPLGLAHFCRWGWWHGPPTHLQWQGCADGRPAPLW